MTNGFLFGGTTGETPESLRRKRELAALLLARNTQAPQNIGQGLQAIGNAIRARRLMGAAQRGEVAGQQQATDLSNRLLQSLTGRTQTPVRDTQPKAAIVPRPGAISTPARPRQRAAGIGGNIGTAISTAAQKHGVDPNTLAQIAVLESGGDPNAKNPRSSAAGLFQFTDATAKDVGLRDKFDPNQSADAAAQLARSNMSVLRDRLGREPSPGEVYLAHQQGAGGASQLLTNPNARAIDVVGRDEVLNNGGNVDMTAGEFARLWTSRLDGPGGVQTAQAQPTIVPTGRAPADQVAGPGIVGERAQETEAVPRQQQIGPASQRAGQEFPQQFQGSELGLAMQVLNNDFSTPASKAVATQVLRRATADPLERRRAELDIQLRERQLGQVPERRTERDANGRLRFIDSGELAFPDIKVDPGSKVLTSDEVKLLGLPPGSYQQKRDGTISQIGRPGTSLVVGPDGTVQFSQGAKLTEGQSKDVVFATRAEGALQSLNQHEDALTNISDAFLSSTVPFSELVTSEEFQLAGQAAREFLQAVLRKDTGAAITAQEVDEYGRVYLPRPGNSPAVLEQKRNARQRALNAIKGGMSPAALLLQEQALLKGSQQPTTEQDIKADRELSIDELIKKHGG